MHISFNSIEELKQFIQFINSDLNSIIKEASKELNTETDKLKQSINQEKK